MYEHQIAGDPKLDSFKQKKCYSTRAFTGFNKYNAFQECDFCPGTLETSDGRTLNVFLGSKHTGLGNCLFSQHAKQFLLRMVRYKQKPRAKKRLYDPKAKSCVGVRKRGADGSAPTGGVEYVANDYGYYFKREAMSASVQTPAGTAEMALELHKPEHLTSKPKLIKRMKEVMQKLVVIHRCRSGAELCPGGFSPAPSTHGVTDAATGAVSAPNAHGMLAAAIAAGVGNCGGEEGLSAAGVKTERKPLKYYCNRGCQGKLSMRAKRLKEKEMRLAKTKAAAAASAAAAAASAAASAAAHDAAASAAMSAAMSAAASGYMGMPQVGTPGGPLSLGRSGSGPRTKRPALGADAMAAPMSLLPSSASSSFTSSSFTSFSSSSSSSASLSSSMPTAPVSTSAAFGRTFIPVQNGCAAAYPSTDRQISFATAGVPLFTDVDVPDDLAATGASSYMPGPPRAVPCYTDVVPDALCNAPTAIGAVHGPLEMQGSAQGMMQGMMHGEMQGVVQGSMLRQEMRGGSTDAAEKQIKEEPMGASMSSSYPGHHATTAPANQHHPVINLMPMIW